MFRNGFTLIEILLVVIVLGVIAGLTLPNMRGAYNDVILKTSVNDLAFLMRYAQSRAVSKASEVRLEFNSDNDRYWLTERSEEEGLSVFNRITGRHAKDYNIPFNVIVQNSQPTVTFYPDGKIEKFDMNVCRQTDLKTDKCFVLSSNQQRGAVHVFEEISQ